MICEVVQTTAWFISKQQKQLLNMIQAGLTVFVFTVSTAHSYAILPNKSVEETVQYLNGLFKVLEKVS